MPDIDLYGPDVLTDPLQHYTALRDAGPAVWLPRNRLWAIARHADVKRALRDAETFRSGAGVGANRLINRLSRHTVLTNDDEVHTARRRVPLRSLGPGERVVLLYAAANRDERACDRPDEFDLHRARHDQLG